MSNSKKQGSKTGAKKTTPEVIKVQGPLCITCRKEMMPLDKVNTVQDFVGNTIGWTCSKKCHSQALATHRRDIVRPREKQPTPVEDRVEKARQQLMIHFGEWARKNSKRFKYVDAFLIVEDFLEDMNEREDKIADLCQHIQDVIDRYN